MSGHYSIDNGAVRPWVIGMSNDKGKKDNGEAEASAVDGEAAPAVKKKPPLMILIAAGVGALVVLGGGGTAAVMMLGGGHKADAATAKKEKPKKVEDAKAKGKDAKDSPITEGPDGVFFYAMQDQTANIQSADGRPTFLKLKLSFEAPDRDTADAITPNQPRLNDMFQTFLRELRPEDLSGSQGTYQLRMELLRRVNLVIAPAKINTVLIQEMLIQ
jgi:flagellar FliL protein